MRRNFELDGSAIAVAQTLARLDRDCEIAGLPRQERFQLQVCLAELLNNIVEHGYRSHTAGSIRLQIRLTPQLSAIRLRDTGQAFTAPDRAPDPLEENGRGLAIVDAWSDGLRRRRRDGVNRTLLVRRRR